MARGSLAWTLGLRRSRASAETAFAAALDQLDQEGAGHESPIAPVSASDAGAFGSKTLAEPDDARLGHFAPRRGKSPEQHEIYEDVIAVLSGALFISLGMVIYVQASLLTGGIAGLALLIQHATGIRFGLLFFLFNLPFYYLAVGQMGWRFAARSIIAVGIVSLFTRLLENWIGFTFIDPIYGTVLGGLLMGMGLLMLFRHRTGLSGMTILALYLQERWGIRAGWFQLGTDMMVFVLAVFVLPTDRLFLSILGAVVMNAFVAINHKPGRYLGMT